LRGRVDHAGATPVDAHIGYEPDDTDRRDITLLGEVFNVMLPPSYDRM